MNNSNYMKGKVRCPTCGKMMSAKILSNKTELINENEIPISQSKKMCKGFWDEVLKKIDKGKALVIPKEVMSNHSVREAVQRRRKKFPYLKVTQRKLKDGKITTYIINPSEEGR